MYSHVTLLKIKCVQLLAVTQYYVYVYCHRTVVCLLPNVMSFSISYQTQWREKKSTKKNIEYFHRFVESKTARKSVRCSIRSHLWLNKIKRKFTTLKNAAHNCAFGCKLISSWITRNATASNWILWFGLWPKSHSQVHLGCIQHKSKVGSVSPFKFTPSKCWQRFNRCCSLILGLPYNLSCWHPTMIYLLSNRNDPHTNGIIQKEYSNGIGF